MRETFRSLRVRNYRLFASGQLVSLTGTWMQNVGQDWLVLELTHSGTAVGIATALQFLPVLLFGLWGGIVADRYPKRRILVLTQSVLGVLALGLGLLVVTGTVELWMVYVFAFLLGLTTVVDLPTRQAFVIEMVGRDDVANAVALNSATFNLARILGPAAAGLVINLFGTGPVFLANCASYAAVIAGLLRMSPAELRTPKRVARARGQLREGLRYVRSRRDLLLPIALVAVIGTFGLNFQLTLALMARKEFDAGPGTYGMLSSILAVGSLAGALLSARRRGRPRQRLLVGSAITFGGLELLAGLMPNIATFAAVLLITGIAVITFTSTANAIVQLGAGEAMRGRVMALYGRVVLGGTPFGGPLMGWLGEHVGPRSSLVAGGGVSMLTAMAVGAVLLRADGRPLRTYRPRLRRTVPATTYDIAR